MPGLQDVLFSIEPVEEKPFPHVVRDDFLPADLYEELKATFPSCPPGMSPTGFALYRGDEAFHRHLAENPVWEEFLDAFRGPRFVSFCREQFGEVFRRERCRVNLDDARHVDYVEDRTDKVRRHMRPVDLAPEQLWVRTDLHQGKTGYRFRPHLDQRRRLVTCLVYFNDADEIDLVGGDLNFYGSRWRLWRKPTRVRPRGNRAVLFPCSRRSYHSVTPVKAQRAPRHHMQVMLSSSVDAWD